MTDNTYRTDKTSMEEIWKNVADRLEFDNPDLPKVPRKVTTLQHKQNEPIVKIEIKE